MIAIPPEVMPKGPHALIVSGLVWVAARGALAENARESLISPLDGKTKTPLLPIIHKVSEGLLWLAEIEPISVPEQAEITKSFYEADGRMIAPYIDGKDIDAHLQVALRLGWEGAYSAFRPDFL
jgi:hypothetical protein